MINTINLGIRRMGRLGSVLLDNFATRHKVRHFLRFSLRTAVHIWISDVVIQGSAILHLFGAIVWLTSVFQYPKFKIQSVGLHYTFKVHV